MKKTAKEMEKERREYMDSHGVDINKFKSPGTYIPIESSVIAFQWLGEINSDEVLEFCCGKATVHGFDHSIITGTDVGCMTLKSKVSETGEFILNVGDYIIKHKDGEFFASAQSRFLTLFKRKKGS